MICQYTRQARPLVCPNHVWTCGRLYFAPPASMDEDLAAARAAQAARWAAAKAAEATSPAPAAAGSSRRKAGAQPKRGGRSTAAAAAEAPRPPPGDDDGGGGPGGAPGSADEKDDDGGATAGDDDGADFTASLLRRAVGGGGAARPAKRLRVASLSADALAALVCTDGSAASDAPLQREGDAAARMAAAAERRAAFAFADGGWLLVVCYKAIRTQLEERVQALSRDEVVDVLRRVAARGSSRRRAASSLLSPRSLALRCPALFWNAVRHFGGCEAAAAAAAQPLQQQAAPE